MPLSIAPDAPLPGIEHIVVVMLENRSFDNVLGSLPGVDGIPPGAQNSWRELLGTVKTVTATTVPPSGKSISITPNPDPGESQGDMHEQLFNQRAPTPDMGGFAQNYRDRHPVAGNPGDILCYFDLNSHPPALAVTAALAQAFAVSDRWFASGPVQTFMNRTFSMCAMPGEFGNGYAINDSDFIFQGGGFFGVLGSVQNRTIFHLLDRGGSPDPANWKVYFHDVPLSALSSYVNNQFGNGPCVASYDTSDYAQPYGTTFAADVAAGTLPAFSIIEPRYFGNYTISPANSNHPGNDNWIDGGLTGSPIDVRNGEDLLSHIVGTLRSNAALFASTLLIVVYDEHGGVYDHVPPPPAPPLDPGMTNSNVYGIYGVRVPALLVNPRIEAGHVFRPQSGVFDHTSIISTVRAQFGLGGPLTVRDQNAPTLAGLIPSNATPRDLSSLQLPAPAKPPAAPVARLTIAQHQQRVSQWVQAKGKATGA
jgi:phospholipase C